jgi:hypothetical protein
MHVCPVCTKRKAITDFAVIRFGVPLECKECVRETKIAAARERLKQIAQRTGMADFTKLAQPKIETPHISQLCESLINQWGGLQSFTNFVYSQTMAAAAKNPGSKAVLDSCKTVINLVNMSTEHRKSAPDVSELSDAEIERQRMLMLMELITRDTSTEVVDVLLELRQGLGNAGFTDAERRRLPEAADAVPRTDGGEGAAGERPAAAIRADSRPGPGVHFQSLNDLDSGRQPLGEIVDGSDPVLPDCTGDGAGVPDK